MDDVELQDLIDKAVEELKQLIGNQETANYAVDEMVKKATGLDPDNYDNTTEQVKLIQLATTSAFQSLIAQVITFW